MNQLSNLYLFHRLNLKIYKLMRTSVYVIELDHIISILELLQVTCQNLLRVITKLLQTVTRRILLHMMHRFVNRNMLRNRVSSKLRDFRTMTET